MKARRCARCTRILKVQAHTHCLDCTLFLSQYDESVLSALQGIQRELARLADLLESQPSALNPTDPSTSYDPDHYDTDR